MKLCPIGYLATVGVIGNEAADYSSMVADISAQHLAVPLIAADTNRLVGPIRKSSFLSLWLLPAYHHSRLYALDLQLVFRAIPDLHRRRKAALHRLHLGA